jgi:acylphosphatase
MSISTKISVSGVVQGVGFRYFVYELANSFNLAGYVKNLYSGDVEIEVEGDENIINAFIKEINIGPRHGHVTGLNVVAGSYSGKYKKFEIRH